MQWVDPPSPGPVEAAEPGRPVVPVIMLILGGILGLLTTEHWGYFFASGPILLIGLSLYVIVLVGRRLRHTADSELAIDLAGAMAPFVALTLEGFSGPFTTSAAAGPYFWFAIGIAAYWFGSDRYKRPVAEDGERIPATDTAPLPAPEPLRPALSRDPGVGRQGRRSAGRGRSAASLG